MMELGIRFNFNAVLKGKYPSYRTLSLHRFYQDLKSETIRTVIYAFLLKPKSHTFDGELLVLDFGEEYRLEMNTA